MYGTMTSETAESKVYGNGSYKPNNSEAGAPAAREVNPITEFCFATGIPGLAKLTLGSKNKPRGIRRKRASADELRC